MSVDTKIQADVCVIGGGPAGAGLARRLRQFGHSVVLVERQSFPRPHVGESLISGVLPLLDVLEVRQEIESAGFLRPKNAIVRWASPVEQLRIFDEPGFQVDRGRFDQILLDAAVRAGVKVFQPAKAMRPKSNGNGGWRIEVHSQKGDIVIESRFVADATGRSAFLGGPRHYSSPRTMAIYAYWRNVALDGPETRVEAGQDEWYWGAPLPGGVFNATVFIDSSRYAKAVSESGSLGAFYRALILRSELLAVCLQGSLTGRVLTCDATQFYYEVAATANSIKVGEAAFSVDPLSSQGVQVALGSALHSAAVINTILRRPEDTSLALDFYRRRQTSSIALHVTAAAKMYDDAGLSRRGVFWRKRAAQPDRLESSAAPRQGAMLNFSTEVRWEKGVRFDTVPTIQGDSIVRTTALISNSVSEPIAFLHDTAIAPLASMIRNRITVEQILRLWSDRIPPSRALAIVGWLWEAGVLCPTDETVNVSVGE